MLKRTPSLVEQVKSHLKQRIVNAEFTTGRIPAEADLAVELNVSRNTIRDALSRLQVEGIISRRQGAGTFVNGSLLLVKTRLEEIVPYDALIGEHGFVPTVNLLSVTEAPADEKTATSLDLLPGDRVISVQKLFLADDKPVIFTLTWLPAGLLKKKYSPADLSLPVYRFLPEFAQVQFGYYVTEIVPIVASAGLANRLQLPADQPAVLAFEEVGYTPDNLPVVVAHSYFRNDLLRLHLIRRPIE